MNDMNSEGNGTETIGNAGGRPSDPTDIYDLVVRGRDGGEQRLDQWRGQVLLVVNTATGCGFTPQYEGLETLYERYRDRGFTILDFPCNQFAGQAPGSAEDIHSFCTLHYNTAFPQFAKIAVNGRDADPLYVWLKNKRARRDESPGTSPSS